MFKRPRSRRPSTLGGWHQHRGNGRLVGRLPRSRRDHRRRGHPSAHAVTGAGQRRPAFRRRRRHGRRGRRGIARPARQRSALADRGGLWRRRRAAGCTAPSGRSRGRPRRRPRHRRTAGRVSCGGRGRPLYRRAAGRHGRDGVQPHRGHHHDCADGRGAVPGVGGGVAAGGCRSAPGPSGSDHRLREPGHRRGGSAGRGPRLAAREIPSSPSCSRSRRRRCCGSSSRSCLSRRTRRRSGHGWR